MTKTSVYLRHSTINGGAAVQVYCTGVTVNLNKSNDKKPNANYSTTTTARVQSLSLENPKYVLNSVKLMGNLDYATLQSFWKLANQESDPIILTVVYGKESSLTGSSSSDFENLVAFDGSTTDIPITFDGQLSIPFDTKNSTNAYRPSFNINLVEVRAS